jgi:hypothetical protein
MPRKPKAETRSTALNGMKLETISFSASSRTDAFFGVASIDAPTSLAAAAEKALDDQVQNLIHGDENRLLSAEKLTLKGYPGRWYKAIVEGGSQADEKLYLIKRRLYVCWLFTIRWRRGRRQEIL